MHFPDTFIEWAHNSLSDSEEAQAYLRSRGVSPEQCVRHRLGYVGGDFDVSPSGHPGHSDDCHDREKRSKWCDVCRYRRWSSTWEGEEGTFKEQHVGRRIAGCVVLPLTSYSGMTVGFQVRAIKDKSYDTFVVNRRPEGYFFGTSASVNEIWRRREVALVEGPFDHLIFERLVMPTVLALTTNSVNQLQMKFLKRFVRRVYLCFDRDQAGRDGREGFAEKTMSEFDLVSVDFPKIGGSKDLNDLWKKVGDDKFRKHLLKFIV